MPGDNDDLGPPAGFMGRIVGNESLDIQMVKKGDGLPLIITFGGCGIDPDTGRAQYALRNTLRDEDVNQIRLRDQYSCWFHNGVQGASTDIQSTVHYLRDLIQDFKADRILCSGASGGGYAAILFGSLLNVTGVVALAPQTILHRGIRCQAHGNLYLLKWTDGNGSWEHTKQQYADLLDLPPSETKIFIVYGSQDLVDAYHAQRIQHRPNIQLKKVAGDHSTAIIGARDSGMLTTLLREMRGKL
jgi:hypothetical protein